ncbi:helix-turn-helix domain-containing protein [Salinispirillum marinum]|uniref:Helix-turn-helix domain-containing protein n=2 Tax=Saccharospirillaceae TaxID=255527 RepID=A0ABV8BGX2_9GAMM
MSTREPEFELVPEDAHCIRYLEHGADSQLIRWHYHKEYELHLLVSTRGKAFVGDYIGPFAPGCLVLTGPNLPHNWITLGDMGSGIRDRVINFSHEFMVSLMQSIPEARQLETMLESSVYGLQFTPHVTEQVLPLFEEVSQSEGFSRVAAFLKIMAHLAASKAYTTLSSRRYNHQHDQKTIAHINRVVNYITQNFTQDITLEDAAAQLNMGPVVFSRFFHRATGQRFKDVVLQLRVSKACEYLEMTDDPVTNICFNVGFSNVSNFNRRFLAIKGMTPTEYRKNIAQRDRRAREHILL